MHSKMTYQGQKSIFPFPETRFVFLDPAPLTFREVYENVIEGRLADRVIFDF